MSDDEYRGVEHRLIVYPCGLRAGDRLRLKVLVVVKDHKGRPTGKTHDAGGVWTVTAGATEEPEIVWLQQPDGKSHTWDASVIFDSFERVR